MTGTEEGPQRIVARHRDRALGGRGPGAAPAETDRYKRERPTLGRLPTPLEREMVHLRTAEFRRGTRTNEDASPVDAQSERLEKIWGLTTTDTQRIAARGHGRTGRVPRLAVVATIVIATLAARRVIRSLV